MSIPTLEWLHAEHDYRREQLRKSWPSTTTVARRRLGRFFGP